MKLIFALLASLCLPAVSAQVPQLQAFHTILGQNGAQLGFAVANASDLDGDGIPETLVGSPGVTLPLGPAYWNGVMWVTPPAPDSGRVTVVSGMTGEVIHTIDSNGESSQFGFAVEGLGDLDGDGVPDFAVGAPADGLGVGAFDSGSVRIHSGATFAQLWVINGNPYSRFGTSLAATGDVDGLGKSELLIGAPNDGNCAGSVTLVSFDQLTTLGQPTTWTWSEQSHHTYGGAVTGGRDVNGDGIPDFVVGASGSANPAFCFGGPFFGQIFVYAGTGAPGFPFGSLLYSTGSPVPGDWFGYAVDLLEDVNGDGRADIVVGAPQAGSGAGSFAVRSGFDGTALITVQGLPGEGLGVAVARIGDKDGDQFQDIAVGAHPGERVAIFEANTWSQTFQVLGPGFGWAIAPGGDVVQDGLDDLLVGARTLNGLSAAYRLAHYPGSGADLILKTGLNSPLSALTTQGIKQAQGTDTLSVLLSSPAGTFTGAAHFLLAEGFPTGGQVPLTGSPILHVSLSNGFALRPEIGPPGIAPWLLALSPILPYPGPAYTPPLPAAGSPLAALLSPSLAGTSVLLQGGAFGPLGVYLSNAHEIRMQ